MAVAVKRTTPGSMKPHHKRPKPSFPAHSTSHALNSTRLPHSIVELPIFQHRGEILAAIAAHPTVVIVGETGSGKSTQLPKILHNAGFKSIVCTQPRRVAAITLAQRVAEEIGAVMGALVGYSVRFDDKSSSDTRIKYVTDGVLLRECMTDPSLSRYDVIILDEAHERSLQTDILAGCIHDLQLTREDLKVVVMSATLDTHIFRQFFRDPAMVTVKGRQHPVDVYYCTEAQEDFLDAALITALQIHEEESEGDVLIFLPGQEEIEALTQLLTEHLRKSKLKTHYLICPMYAALPAEEQRRVFEPTPNNTRKFICATNIAETSITISGVRFVVDPGLAKMRYYHAGTGMEALKISPISQAQAWQRTGRAGREAPGKCYRLYTEPSFDSLDLVAIPEIQRVNITQVILQLKAMGIARPQDFSFISAPSVSTITRALELLFVIGALDATGNLTAHGRQMARLPLDPLFAHLLIRSQQFQCVQEALTAVAMVSAENVFVTPIKNDEKALASEMHKQLSVHDGDLSTLVNVYDSWTQSPHRAQWCRQNYISHRALMRANEIRQQLHRLMEELGYDVRLSCGTEKEQFLKCICAGLFTNAVRRRAPSQGKRGHYSLLLATGRTSTNTEVYIHPASTLHARNPPPAYLVFCEMVETSRQYMRTLTIIQGTWLHEVAPHIFQQRR